jgi:RHS repeat-associated protein
VILLAEHDEPSLAAKKKRQPGTSSKPTSTPKNRVWDFGKLPSGRPCSESDLSWETATGSVRYTYENVSGRGEFISRDPLSGAEFSQGTNLYAYCRNNFVNLTDPTGQLSSVGTYLQSAAEGAIVGGITNLVGAAVVAVAGLVTGNLELEPVAAATLANTGNAMLWGAAGGLLLQFLSDLGNTPIDLNDDFVPSGDPTAGNWDPTAPGGGGDPTAGNWDPEDPSNLGGQNLAGS